MRHELTLVSIVTCVLSLASVAGADGLTPDASPVVGVVEGYLGGAVADPDNGSDRSDFTGGGVGSAVGRWGPFYLQADVFGDGSDLGPGFSNVGGGGHLGLVSPDLGWLGISGADQRFDIDRFGNEDIYRVGGEAELYLGRLTLGTWVGYLEESKGNDGGVYARGSVRLYPTATLRLEGVGGYVDQGSFAIARAAVEYRPANSWIGLFARWEAAFDGSGDLHQAVAGVRVYFDPGRSLREMDREYFHDACLPAFTGARIC